MKRIKDTFYNPAAIEKIELKKWEGTDLYIPRIFYISGKIEDLDPETWEEALYISKAILGEE